MPQNDPAREDRLARHLNRGLPIDEAARKAGVSIRTAYRIADRNQLPTNAPVPEGSRRERQIIDAYHILGKDAATVCAHFWISEPYLRKVLADIRKRARVNAA